MSVADWLFYHNADELNSREESESMNQEIRQERQPTGQRVRWLVAEFGYRLVALGAWLERFGPQQPES